ncbi:MAG: DUF5596 domain-containing protein [Kiritimatiellae bacterium]|nr:DUF5596 domain-containing protein [Kiritimatiellia bacterium]
MNELGETRGRDALEPGWETSVDTCPAGSLEFLAQDAIGENRVWTGLPNVFDPLLAKTARTIQDRPALRLLAWHTYRLVYQTAERRAFNAWPELNHALDGSGGVFYLLLAMAAIGRLREQHRAHGIPETVTRATAAGIRIACERYGRISDGHPGIERKLLWWYRLVASGDLHRLGRMQYHFRPFGGRLRAFRHRRDGCVLALSEPGVTYDTEGFVAWSDSVPAWTSELTQAEDRITGCPISPTGRALRTTVTLRTDSWHCVLQPGDTVLGTHIPEGEPMSLERCRQTMAQALEFFPKHYPDRSLAGFECHSWILNTQLVDMLGQASNLVKYQQELYLFPLPSGGKDGLYFVFDRDEVDPDTAPRDTALRRAFLDHLKAGKRLRTGGMFFLREDFSQFGSQHYRARFEAAMSLAARSQYTSE